MAKSLSKAEENYLKAIYKLFERQRGSVSTNSIAEEMSTTAASVSDMLKKLSDKKLINYEKYYGATLSDQGKAIATKLVRRHRLWETFLVSNLKFGWEEVHDLAEELEHVPSDRLIDRLEEFLSFPKFDPHGDPIPDRQGRYTLRVQYLLSDCAVGDALSVVGVQNHSRTYLEVLKKLDIALGTTIQIEEKLEYDRSMKVMINSKTQHQLTYEISSQLYVRRP